MLTDIPQRYAEALAAIGAVVVAAEALVRALQMLIRALSWAADLTASRVDNDAAQRALVWLTRVHDGLHWFERKLPRGALGKKVKP